MARLSEMTGTRGTYEISTARSLGHVVAHMAYNAESETDEALYLIALDGSVYAQGDNVHGWMRVHALGHLDEEISVRLLPGDDLRPRTRGYRIEVCEAPVWQGRSESHRFVAEVRVRPFGLGWGATRGEAALAARRDLKANRAFIGPRRENGDR